jgi:pimeloyl-ACP methyl ester carboxylesterase
MFEQLSTTIEGINLSANFYRALGDEKPFTLFCLPGGGSSAEFFDLHPDYSFVKRMNSAGYNVITMDHPGTASNKIPFNQPFLKPRIAAEYIALALAEWNKGVLIGVGHSMGGMTTTLIQAKSKSFKAIALLGSNAGGLDWGLNDHEKTYINKPDKFSEDIEKLVYAKFGCEFTKIPSGPSGKSITFGGQTEELTKSLREVSCELYAAGGLMSMIKGSFSKEVEAIKASIFFACGDHDIGISPAEIEKYYTNASNTKLIILKNTGHNHFAFDSIGFLCESLDCWASSLT